MLTRSALADSRSRVVQNLAPNPGFRRAFNGSTVMRKNLFTNPRMERVSAGTTAVRRNLVTNPAVASAAGWSAIGGGTGSAWTGAVIAGGGPTAALPNYYRTTKTALETSGSSWLRVQYGAIPVVGRRVVTFSAYGRWNSPTAVALVIIAVFRTAANQPAATPEVVGTNREDLGNGWYRYYVTTTVPADATSAYIHFGVSGGSKVGDTVDLTGAMIEERPAMLPFFMGSTANDRSIAYEWEGTANASASIARAGVVEVFRNYHRNPGARNASQPDVSTWAGSGTNASSTNFTADAAWAKSGKAVQVTWTAISDPSAGDIAPVATQALPDTVFTMEYDLVVNRTANVSAPGMYSATGTTSTIARSHLGLVSLTAGVPQRRWITFTADATAISTGALRVPQTMYDKVAGDSMAVSNILLYPGAKRTDLPWFDGNNTPDADLTPSWTGTADASQSILSGVGISDLQNANSGEHRVAFYRSYSRGLVLRPLGSTNDSAVNVGATLRGSLVAGRTYTIIASFSQDAVQTGTMNFRARSISWRDDGTDWAGSLMVVAANTVGTQTLRMTFTPKSNTGQVLRLYHGNPTGAPVYWDDIAIVEGAYTGPVFDGDMGASDGTGITYSWDGATHASTTSARALMVEVRRNFCSNPTAGGTSTASVIGNGNGGGTVTRITTEGRSDTNSYSYVAGTTSAGDKGPQVFMGSLVAGRTYTVSAWVKASGLFTASGLRAGVYWGNWLGTSSWVTTVGSWVQVSSTFVVPATGGTGAFVIGAPQVGAQVGVDLLIDDILIEESSTVGTYFDGNTSPDSDMTPQWNGTADASTSILMGPAVQGTGYSSSVKAILSDSPSAGRALRLINTSPTVSDSFAHVGGDTGGLRLGMVPGRTYTAIVTARFTTPRTESYRVSMKTYTRAAPAGYVALGVNAPLAPGTYELRATFTLPPDATEAFVRLYNAGFQGVGDAWFENFMLVEGVYTGKYIDGTMPNVVWLGNPNDSVSSGYPPK